MLMHATQTRADIQMAVHVLAGYIKEPGEKHMQAAERVMGYLKGTKDYRLQLGGNKNAEVLEGYVDSSFAEEEERRAERVESYFTMGQ